MVSLFDNELNEINNYSSECLISSHGSSFIEEDDKEYFSSNDCNDDDIGKKPTSTKIEKNKI